MLIIVMSLYIGIIHVWSTKTTTLQVNPSVYGDRQTRLYVYWTVSFLIIVHFASRHQIFHKLFISCFAHKIMFHHIMSCSYQADGSKRTGCFDLTCPGFIQTSNQIVLGAAIYPISNPTGLPYQITVYIYEVRKSKNLFYNLPFHSQYQSNMIPVWFS